LVCRVKPLSSSYLVEDRDDGVRGVAHLDPNALTCLARTQLALIGEGLFVSIHYVLQLPETVVNFVPILACLYGVLDASEQPLEGVEELGVINLCLWRQEAGGAAEVPSVAHEELSLLTIWVRDGHLEIERRAILSCFRIIGGGMAYGIK